MAENPQWEAMQAAERRLRFEYHDAFSEFYRAELDLRGLEYPPWLRMRLERLAEAEATA